MAHWADEFCDGFLADRPDSEPIVIATGITPSGEIHIGNMREVMTADVVYRALRERGREAVFHYIADSFDPLRRVYPFLDQEAYREHVGRPISEIPCPCGGHASYSDHFLEPFLASLEELGIRVELIKADEMYKTGRFNAAIGRALEARDAIGRILNQVTGKQIADDWSPFMVLCPDCGRMSDAVVVGFDAGAETVDYKCGCGSEGRVPLAGGGKLTWRVDWPARWEILGVGFEPMGKDHGVKGGSYDTGRRIAAEVFGGAAPATIIYEWISLKGRGDMSSSKGNVLSISDMLRIVPPEILRYLIVKSRPKKKIDFDPGIPLLQLIDEYDDLDSGSKDERALALSRAGGLEPVGVPFNHLVTVFQVAGMDADAAMEILERNGYAVAGKEQAIRSRIDYARRWLEEFAPEEARFALALELPESAANLSDEQKRALRALAGKLEPGMTAEDVHNAVYAVKEELGLKPADVFKAVYRVLIDRDRGPRAGWFIAMIGVDFARARFLQV